MVTNLLGRRTITSWDGKTNGIIVAVFCDRGEVYVCVERPISHSTDGRTQVDVCPLNGTLLAGYSPENENS